MRSMKIQLDKSLKITKITKKTSAKMFSGLLVGDILEIKVTLKEAGRNRGTYATYIEFKNNRTQEISCKSFNEAPSILDCFEFEEIVVVKNHEQD